jgi:hypothetical protein
MENGELRYRANAMIELPPIGRNNSIHLNNRKNEGETTVSPSFCHLNINEPMKNEPKPV